MCLASQGRPVWLGSMLLLRLASDVIRNNRDPAFPGRRAGYAAGCAAASCLTATTASHAGKAARISALMFLLLPDVPLVLGLRPEIVAGQLHPRMVPAYNATHRFAGPITLCAVASALRSPALRAAGMAWFTHVCFDRAAGFGLRGRDGWLRSRSRL
jgi:Domain of unknown function (DUF4260)